MSHGGPTQAGLVQDLSNVRYNSVKRIPSELRPQSQTQTMRHNSARSFYKENEPVNRGYQSKTEQYEPLHCQNNSMGEFQLQSYAGSPKYES